MDTFTKLAEHFRVLVHHGDKTSNKDVEATAARAACLFRQYHEVGKFPWFQRDSAVWDLRLGKTTQASDAMHWRLICSAVCQCSGERIGDSYSIGAADVEQETVGPGTRTGVIGFSDSRYIQRAAEYAGICDVLAQEAGETRNTATAKTAPKAKGKRKRRRTEKPLTALQQQALELFAKYNGRIADIATAMGVKHPTVNQHLKAAWRKLPSLAPKKTGPAGKARHLPKGRRGEPAM